MRPRARRAESHVTADRYKIEIDKSCWRQQLINLKARHGGTLPDDEVKKLYTEFSCPFGCFPPVMKPEEFLNMQVNLMSCAGFANTNPNNNHTRARAARASRLARLARLARLPACPTPNYARSRAALPAILGLLRQANTVCRAAARGWRREGARSGIGPSRQGQRARADQVHYLPACSLRVHESESLTGQAG